MVLNYHMYIVFYCLLTDKQNILVFSFYLTDCDSFASINNSGFALSIAIVAKCDKTINVAQDFFIWRKCVATTFC